MNFFKSASFRWLFPLISVWLFQTFCSDQIDPYYYSILIYSGINIILAVSLNLVNGFTGQFSMGHAGFMSIGAYTAAFLSGVFRAKWPDVFSNAELSGSGSVLFLVALIAGGVLSMAIGFLVGLPSLRLKGDYLAIVTLGFGEIIRVVLLNMSSLGGARGMPDILGGSNFGWVYTFVIVTLFVVWRVLEAPSGRALLSVREDEIAAEAMGVHTTRAKVRAFVIGAFFAGVAGGLFAHFLRYLNPAIFDFNKSFEVIIMVVLGGMGSITGSVVAAIFLTVIREALRPLQEITKLDFRMIIYSLTLIVMMLNRPNGMLGTKELVDFFKRKSKKSEVSS